MIDDTETFPVGSNEAADDNSRSPAVVERRGTLAVLTLNRPEALNAVNRDLSTAADVPSQPSTPIRR